MSINKKLDTQIRDKINKKKKCDGNEIYQQEQEGF